MTSVEVGPLGTLAILVLTRQRSTTTDNCVAALSSQNTTAIRVEVSCLEVPSSLAVEHLRNWALEVSGYEAVSVIWDNVLVCPNWASAVLESLSHDASETVLVGGPVQHVTSFHRPLPFTDFPDGDGLNLGWRYRSIGRDEVLSAANWAVRGSVLARTLEDKPDSPVQLQDVVEWLGRDVENLSLTSAYQPRMQALERKWLPPRPAERARRRGIDDSVTQRLTSAMTPRLRVKLAWSYIAQAARYFEQSLAGSERCVGQESQAQAHYALGRARGYLWPFRFRCR